MTLALADYDFALPPELIAQHPTPERSASRLLDGTGPQAQDRVFRDLPGLLSPGDLLVFNDTRVIKVMKARYLKLLHLALSQPRRTVGATVGASAACLT